MTRYVRRPRVGDYLETGRYGVVRVSTVKAFGRKLDVVDRFGRTWPIERADTGWWWRAEASEMDQREVA